MTAGSDVDAAVRHATKENAPRRYPEGVCKSSGRFGWGLLDGLAGDVGNVRAADAEIAEFAVAHAAEFRYGLTILAPIAERACEIHVIPLSRVLQPAAALRRRPLI